MSRIRLGDTEPIGALFLDGDGVTVTGLSPVVIIRRAVDGTFWNGSSYQATAIELAMTEVSVAEAPGEYQYDFTPGASGKHFWTVRAETGQPPYGTAPASDVVGPVQPGEVDVGGWANNVDVQVSSRLSTADFNTGVTSILNLDNANTATLLASIEIVRKWTQNRVEITGTGPFTVTVYDDDGTTPAFSFTVSADFLTRTP